MKKIKILFFVKRISRNFSDFFSFLGNLEMIKVLAPLCTTHNLNAGNEYETTLGCAARKGHIDIVKFLAPLIENPNAPSYQRFPMSTIQMAEIYGHTNVAKYLKKLMKI